MTEPKYQDQFLMQKQLNLQALTQLQHQRNICEIMFSALSSAEKVALKLSKNKEYKNYDPFNSSSYKNEIQLENELANKLVYLRAGLLSFKMQHGEFIFPDANIKKEMIDDINKWSKLIKNRPKAIESYKTLLELLNGSTKEISKNCFHVYDVKPDEKSTLDWAEGLMFEAINIDKQDKEVQKDYEKTGTHKIPFKKEKNKTKFPNDIDILYNKYINDEKNTKNSIENLIKRINSGKNITQEDDNIIRKYINQLKNSLDKIDIDNEHIYQQIEYYNQLINNAAAMLKKNIIYNYIIQYCKEVLTIYNNNLNEDI